jgi:hypothetical protein
MDSTESKSLILRTLVLCIPCTGVGYFSIMAWGINAQAGRENALLTTLGIAGYILLLPTMLLGYLTEAVGGFGMAAETLLMFAAQFAGYFALVWGLSKIHWRFSLRTLLIAMTVAAVALGLVVWAVK